MTDKTKKPTKKDYSDFINEAYKLKNDHKIDFTKLKEVDLAKFYFIISVQKEVASEMDRPRGLNRGLFGFGILDGGLIRDLTGSKEKRRGIIKKVLNNMDSETAQRVIKHFPIIAELGLSILEEDDD